jgi:hypothetical protein
VHDVLLKRASVYFGGAVAAQIRRIVPPFFRQIVRFYVRAFLIKAYVYF